MSSLNTHVAENLSMEKICNTRDEIVRNIDMAYQLLGKAGGLMMKLGTQGIDPDSNTRSTVERATKDVDPSLWQAVFKWTGLSRIMDSEATRAFIKDLEKNPPPLTIDNVRSQVLTVSQTADEMFARGVYNVLRKVSREYRTNNKEAFKVSDKIIVGYMFTREWCGEKICCEYSAYEKWDDIDRVFTTLAGEHYRPHQLHTQINAACRAGAFEFENTYMRVKGHKNGNAHIFFTRPELLEKVIDLIAAYCGGNAIPDVLFRKGY